jgi:type IV fimbrial biogenesis protein FimT
MNNNADGFTLVELMVTLAVVGVLTSIAAPSFRGMVLDTRLSNQANDMLLSLKFTRSEAVKRNARVTMCRSSTGTGCAAAATGPASWESGWIVFADGGVVGTVDGADTVLRVQGALPTATVDGAGGVADFVSYVGNGQTSAAAGGTQVGIFSLCGPDATARRRKIALTQGSGWVGVQTVAAATTCTSA